MSEPCTCWITVTHVSRHDGHCCFDLAAPADCHDTEGRTMWMTVKESNA